MSNTDTPPPPQLPAPFKRGYQTLKASDLESLRANLGHALNGLIKGGNGILVTQAGNSVIINQLRQPNGSKGYPLQPILSGADKIKFRWGTVNGYTPKIGGIDITAGVDDLANPEFTITESGFIYVKVDVAAQTFLITNPVLEFAATVPPDTAVAAHRALVNVTFLDGAITAISASHRGSIEVATCGGVLYYWDLGETNDITYNYYEGYY